MRRLTLTFTILALLTLPACQSPLTDLLFDYTGEEDLLPQVRGIAQLATALLHPRPRTAPDVPVTHAGVNPFGINVFLEQEVEEWKRERSLQMIADAGFHWIRQEFPWEDIEIHGKGDFEDRRHEPHRSAWEKYDHIVGLAEQYGLEVIPRLSNPPAWTRALSDTIGTHAPPDDLADWGDYVYAVVSRYRGRVRYYQLWNEPNIYPEWGERPVDPEGYTQLLCEGYRRAKEADPDAVVISGALAPTVSLHPGPGAALGLNEFVFLQRMYNAGAADCFDILAVNDYLLWSGPTDRRMQPLNINFSRPIYIRDIMVVNGDAAKPIWISEMNSDAVPKDAGIADFGRYGYVTPEQQARYAVLAYRRVMEEWPWVGVVNFWFFKRATDLERDQAMYYFRMVEPDFTPMPVYEEMQEYTANLTPMLYPGTHQEDHWALEYSDDWETVRVGESASRRISESASQRELAAVLRAYRRTTSPSATLHFWFEGASLTLRPGPGVGEVELSVDGGAVRRVSLDGQPVRLVAGWRRQRHNVTLTAVAGEVSVDMLTVQRSWRPSLWLILGTAGLIIAVGWLLVLRR
ncbi:MAG: hypothetical protein ACE5OS_05160 [Anaerolineae bacterium]